MTRYLLGELTDAELSAFEARYFTEPAPFAELLAPECTLIDDYWRKLLSTDMRERFENAYRRNAARKERVRFGDALVSRIDRMKRPAVPADSRHSLLAWFSGRRPALAFSFAAVLSAVAIGGIWL